LTLDDIVPTESLSGSSAKDIAKSQERDQSVEPLRFLILGQVSSGKSSLINALFGEMKSASGFLPTTSDITPYVLERDGLQQAIILDSAGYGGAMHETTPHSIKEGMGKNRCYYNCLQCCASCPPCRCETIGSGSAIFSANNPNQTLPVIIAVATHIDRLRPVREWQPPYQIQQPDNAKAHSIRQACLAIAKELTLPLDCVVPCALPLKSRLTISKTACCH
jgi:uncharacterized protein